MKRRLHNLLTGFSMVVCVAVMALWVRSCAVADGLTHIRRVGWTVLPQPGGGTRAYYVFQCSRIMVSNGRYRLHWWRTATGAAGTDADTGWRYRAYEPEPWKRGEVLRMGFDFNRQGANTLVVVPAWALAAVTGLPPALSIIHKLRRRKRRWRAAAPPAATTSAPRRGGARSAAASPREPRPDAAAARTAAARPQVMQDRRSRIGCR
jgi:hypothetical protein